MFHTDHHFVIKQQCILIYFSISLVFYKSLKKWFTGRYFYVIVNILRLSILLLCCVLYNKNNNWVSRQHWWYGNLTPFTEVSYRCIYKDSIRSTFYKYIAVPQILVLYLWHTQTIFLIMDLYSQAFYMQKHKALEVKKFKEIYLKF